MPSGNSRIFTTISGQSRFEGNLNGENMIGGNYYVGSTYELILETGMILSSASSVAISVKFPDGTVEEIAGEVHNLTAIKAVLTSDTNDQSGQLLLQAKATITPEPQYATTGPGSAFFTNPTPTGEGGPLYFKVTRDENPAVFDVNAYATAQDRATGSNPEWTAAEQTYSSTPGTLVGMGRPWDMDIAALTQDDVHAQNGLIFNIVEAEPQVYVGVTEEIVMLQPFAEEP